METKPARRQTLCPRLLLSWAFAYRMGFNATGYVATCLVQLGLAMMLGLWLRTERAIIYSAHIEAWSHPCNQHGIRIQGRTRTVQHVCALAGIRATAELLWVMPCCLRLLLRFSLNAIWIGTGMCMDRGGRWKSCPTCESKLSLKYSTAWVWRCVAVMF